MDEAVKDKLPRHVGIIMDGNGRWAAAHGFSRARGHRAGVERLRGVIRLSSDLGIEVISVYAFSTENWKRPAGEVDTLMALLREFFTTEIDELHANRVKIRILGALTGLPAGIRGLLQAAMDKTAENDGLQLNIAFNYGSRAEVVRAAQMLAREVRDGVMEAAQIDEAALLDKLYTAGQPDMDFLIRTSGEQRLSNFLLLQAAYAELYFTPVYWPDFTDDLYREALQSFAARERRYGGI